MNELNIAGRLATFLKVPSSGKEEDNIEAFRKACEEQSKVPGITGVELHYPAGFVIDTAKMKELLDAVNLKVSALNPRFVKGFAKDDRFRDGALSHLNPVIRQAAIDLVKRNADAAKILGCEVVNIWVDRDGHMYSFEKDCAKLWDNFVDSLQQIADYAPDVKFAIEYKYEETPVKTLVRDAGRTLAIILETNRENVGANVDYNHTIMAQESPAEVYDMFLARGKLFNIHLNDSWYYDDDIMVGSNTPISLLEVMYLLRKYDYKGWIYFDTKIIKGDPVEECVENVETTNQFWKLAHDIDLEELEELRKKDDYIGIKRMIRKLLFKE